MPLVYLAFDELDSLIRFNSSSKAFLMLTSKEQIEDAMYFVDQLKEKYERNEARAVVSAILSIIRSVPDHLLEEYNRRLGLNIPLSTPLRTDIFEDEAKKLGNNSRALNFIRFYKAELQNLKTNVLWNEMKTKRDIKIHRDNTLLKKHVHMTISEPRIVLDDRITAITRDNTGNIKKSGNSTNIQDNTKNSEENATKDPLTDGVRWFFEDDPTVDIVNKFEQLLKEVTNFVSKVETAFP